MEGLSKFLDKNLKIPQNSVWTVYSEYLSPAYFVALAAYCKLKKISFNELSFFHESTKGYVSAIALESVLNGIDNYQYKRKNSGKNYSKLVLLKSVDDTNKATRTINSCIRNLFDAHDLSYFVTDLCDVVGDLHDNVWSHGGSTGFSMAQKWRKSKKTNEFFFEFALADCGLGFLRELKRVRLDIDDDKGAINWCIEKKGLFGISRETR